MADPSSPVSPVSRSPSIRLSASTSDSIETLSPTPPEPIQSKLVTVKKNELPPHYDEVTPPPSYPASTHSVHDVEVGAAALATVRKRFWRRHPWWCTLTMVVLSAIIGGGIFGGLCWSPDSGCYSGPRPGDNYRPPATSTSSRPTPTSTITMAMEVRPRPTGFAPGKVERLVYEDIGGKRPIVGSTIAAVSIVDMDGRTNAAYERVFYHDTQGQIYESSASRTASFTPWEGHKAGVHWSVWKVTGAVMAVNSSLAVVAVQQDGRYNTTALFFNVNREGEDPGRIFRVLTKRPGEYEEVVRTPYNPIIENRDWRPLAATQIKTIAGPRVILAFWNQSDNAGIPYQTNGLDLVNGMWDTDRNWTTPTWVVDEFRVPGPNEPQVFWATESAANKMQHGGILAMQKAVADNGEEGFILVQQWDVDLEYKEPGSTCTLEQYAESPSCGTPSLVTAFDFYTPSKIKGDSLEPRARFQRVEEKKWSTFAMWPQYGLDRDEDGRPFTGTFSEWSCALQCNRTLYDINLSDFSSEVEGWIPKSPVALEGFGYGPVATTDEHVLYVVKGDKENAVVVEYVADGEWSGRQSPPREVGKVKLFDTSR